MSSKNVERTPDGRYIVVKGRRWRAADPSIPEPLRVELVAALMTGRRMARTHGDAARVMVQDAKVAPGERGAPWWGPTVDEVVAQLRDEGMVHTATADSPDRIAAAEGLEFQPNLPG